MDEQALNKKLAEWAGIEFRPLKEPILGHTFLPYYKGLPLSYEEVNFPLSLDACFKWLVPKLQQLNQPYGYAIRVEFPSGSDVYWASVVDYKELPEKVYSAYNKTAALALCLAIEKLIDSEATSDIRKDSAS